MTTSLMGQTSEAAPAPEAQAEPSAPAPTQAVAEQSATPTRPEHIPENFWDTTTNSIRVDDLAKSYNELRTQFGTRKEEWQQEWEQNYEAKRREGKPEAPDKYEVRAPEGFLPKEYEFKFDENSALLGHFRKFAHENALSQDQFDGMTKAFIEYEMSLLPNPNEEIKKLGDRGRERTARVDGWAAKNLSDKSYQTLVRHATSAEFMEAMEELMDKAGTPGPSADSGAAAQSISRSDLEAMMKDPRYYDPRKRDPGFIKQVEDGFRRLF